MKKIIAIGCLTIVMAGLLTACGKFECGWCLQEKSGKKHKEEILGQEVVICDDCYDEITNAAEELTK